ncbi:hypothetical protein Tco_0523563 [Tanacetum coccineum]
MLKLIKEKAWIYFLMYEHQSIKIPLLKAAQLKKTFKKSKLESRKLHASGSGNGVGSKPKVPDDQEDNTHCGDDESNDDDSDEVTKDEEEKKKWNVKSAPMNDNEASDSEKMDSDKDENPNLNQNDDEEEHEEDMKRREQDEEMPGAGHEEGTQQTTYEQVKNDEHVILTTVHDTQKTKVPLQSSFVSSDFANQFLNLDNVPPTDNEFVSIMNFKVRHEEPSTQTPPLLNVPVTVILKTSSAAGSTIPPTILPITPLQQQSTPTPTPAPTTTTTVTSIPALQDFSSLFRFDQRLQILAMVDAQLSTRLEDSIKKSFGSYTAKFEKKAKDERKRYIDLVEKFVKEIIKDEVKSQLPEILPKEVSDTPLL